MAEPQDLRIFDLEHPLFLELKKAYVFRLIELLPGTSNDDVDIRLSIHELEHAPDYEAISYVWGKRGGEYKEITCNGRKLSITASLNAAFRRTRLKNRPRILWADAICINQDNTDEKSHHVAFMNRVYKQAKAVLVCMGPDSDGGAEVVATLVSEHIKRMSGYTSITDMPILDIDDPVFSDPRWKSLATLMSCEWFGRAWVLQEVGVATMPPRVLYGAADLNYRDLMKLSRWIIRCASKLQQVSGINLLTIHTDWEDWSEAWQKNPEFKYTFLDFLSHAKGLGCRIAHDHVYAFLGHPLAQRKDGGGPIITVDYKQSIGEVYHELTQWMLSEYGLLVLSAVEHDEHTVVDDEQLASWVARWETDIIWNSMGYYWNFYYNASATKGKETSVTVTETTGNLLPIRAVSVDTIAKVYQFSREEDDFSASEAKDALASATELHDILDRIWSDISSEESPYVYASTFKRVDAFSLTLGAGLRNYERAENDLAGYRANFAAFWTLLQQSEGREETPVAFQSEEGGESGGGEADDFWFDMCLSCKGRTFFITEKGYYGLGPWVTKPGNRCFIFDGARVPFVVRVNNHHRQNAESARLVGEAYVHGVMHGEFVQGLDGRDVIWETLTLR